MTPVIIGTLLALVALGFVLAPLFNSAVELVPEQSDSSERPSSDTSLEVEALREIEFDHATGKLSETDYRELKDTYTQRAIVRMRGESIAGSIKCRKCGDMSEEGANFCFSCGEQLL